MSVVIIKTKVGTVNLRALQNEINSNELIVPSCLSISQSDTDLKLEFAAALSVGEESELDLLISGHRPPIENLDVNQLPFSPSLGKKLHVHRSFKPESDKVVYAVWTGKGDNMATGEVGRGIMLDFQMKVGGGDVAKNIRFHPDNGRVWLHEGYLKYENAGPGDFLDVDLIAQAAPLQTLTNLDLIVESNWIKPAPGGAGTGTHGWDDLTKIAPIKRTFSGDGDWDINEKGALVPNLSGNGAYKISDINRIAHNYIIGIPMTGSSSYFAFSSDETVEMPKNYNLRITCFNRSNTNWSASVVMEIYRERTVIP